MIIFKPQASIAHHSDDKQHWLIRESNKKILAEPIGIPQVYLLTISWWHQVVSDKDYRDVFCRFILLPQISFTAQQETKSNNNNDNITYCWKKINSREAFKELKAGLKTLLIENDGNTTDVTTSTTAIRPPNKEELSLQYFLNIFKGTRLSIDNLVVPTSPSDQSSNTALSSFTEEDLQHLRTPMVNP